MIQILIGVVAGIFSGIGMGGGTILIFLLTTFGGLEQHIAQATNIGANMSVHTDVQKLRKLFGIFLLAIAIHEIYTLIKQYKQNKKRHTKIS